MEQLMGLIALFYLSTANIFTPRQARHRETDQKAGDRGAYNFWAILERGIGDSCVYDSSLSLSMGVLPWNSTSGSSKWIYLKGVPWDGPWDEKWTYQRYPSRRRFGVWIRRGLHLFYIILFEGITFTWLSDLKSERTDDAGSGSGRLGESTDLPRSGSRSTKWAAGHCTTSYYFTVMIYPIDRYTDSCVASLEQVLLGGYEVDDKEDFNGAR